MHLRKHPPGAASSCFSQRCRGLLSKRLVSQPLADHMRAELVTDAFQDRGRLWRLLSAVIPSDNRAQHCPEGVTRTCHELGISRSRGAVRNQRRQRRPGVQHLPPDARRHQARSTGPQPATPTSLCATRAGPLVSQRWTAAPGTSREARSFCVAGPAGVPALARSSPVASWSGRTAPRIGIAPIGDT
ncbi:DNA-binding transcriptional ArsR family regulator [Kitasatospora kifunensis]|uniref:DNA-binding transcriptional ArsR family regulator n=1 Tax=Kitasatospora kifunensis TaxID=58351 RepID=A0A7W7RA92_KITKI|nr:DNA-binding transcriptional ArsR family regulator [Kitasatospora kifunensis]